MEEDKWSKEEREKQAIFKGELDHPSAYIYCQFLRSGDTETSLMVMNIWEKIHFEVQKYGRETLLTLPMPYQRFFCLRWNLWSQDKTILQNYQFWTRRESQTLVRRRKHGGQVVSEQNPGCELCGSLVMLICHLRNQSGKVLTTPDQSFSMLSQPHHNFIKRFLAFEFFGQWFYTGAWEVNFWKVPAGH